MSARRLFGLWGPVAAYMGMIFLLSRQSDLPGADLIWDKLEHAGAFGLLGLLALRAFHGGLGRIRPVPTLAAFGLTAGYGALDEFHQSFVMGRSASVGDVAADAVGAVLAVCLAALFISARRSRREEADSPKITLVEHEGCPRCLEAFERLEAVRREIPFRLVRRGSRQVFDADELPLVFLEDRVLFRGTVDPDRLRRALGTKAGSRGYNPGSRSRSS